METTNSNEKTPNPKRWKNLMSAQLVEKTSCEARLIFFSAGFGMTPEGAGVLL
ncbi:MAG: hypothetical protein KJ687_00195 [Proteobacteria bacterium]|nr:hypothetical protein [Pseudomonadota bacterium]